MDYDYSICNLRNIENETKQGVNLFVINLCLSRIFQNSISIFSLMQQACRVCGLFISHNFVQIEKSRIILKIFCVSRHFNWTGQWGY